MKRLNLFFFCLLAMIALSGNAQEKQADANGYIRQRLYCQGGRTGSRFYSKAHGRAEREAVQSAWQSGDAPVYGQLVWRVPQGDAVHRKGYLAEA